MLTPEPRLWTVREHERVCRPEAGHSHTPSSSKPGVVSGTTVHAHGVPTAGRIVTCDAWEHDLLLKGVPEGSSAGGPDRAYLWLRIAGAE